MTLPTADTRVTYPLGGTEAAARVLHAERRDDGRLAVVLDTTAFHPVDHAWPDQGPDRGVLARGDDTWPVAGCVVGATDGTVLHLGGEVPVRKGTEGWVFLVVHLLDPPQSVRAPGEGEDVVVRVDTAYRHAVSVGHTGCHLASLALNQEMADRWRKDVAPDALGAPDFDALAIDTTSIGEHCSVDVYRLGRSLRRKGFTVEGLNPGAITGRVDATLAGWTATGADVRVEADGPGLTDRRRWVCDLPGARAEIPCGGTHPSSLAGLRITVALTVTDAEGTPVLRMDTRVLETAAEHRPPSRS